MKSNYEFISLDKSWHQTNYKKRVYSAPTVVNLEITEGCNFKCLHCYNPWREISAGKNHLTKDQFDFLLNEFIQNGVFHFILSGGEPLANYKLLKYAIPKLLENEISISCNSNLSLMTEERAKELYSLGLDHILGSWYSTDDEITAHITQVDNAQDAFLRGIRNCVMAGIRVSVNTIVTSHTRSTIYKAGELLAKIGVYQFIAHRVIPPAYERTLKEPNPENNITVEDAKATLDDLLALKEKYKINVSTLISYPLCMIGDLDKYSDFVGRGCPSQSGHRFNINASGDTHTCVMEDASYGDIFKDGLKSVYKKTQFWRDNSVLFEGCKSCDYIDVCQTGCRMAALSSTGKIDGKDPLMLGPEEITKPIKAITNSNFLEQLEIPTNEISVAKTLRFREENDFGLVNIRWGNTIEVSLDLFKFLIKNKGLGRFSVQDLLEIEPNKKYLASLFSKEVLEFKDFKQDKSHRGVSIDPCKLPLECFNT